MVSHLQSFWVLKLIENLSPTYNKTEGGKKKEQLERERETNRALNSDQDGEIASYVDDFGQTHVGNY